VHESSARIVVSGLIGAGKSTLVKALAPLLGLHALPERATQNPYLKRFYEDPHRWAFHSFIFFLEDTLRGEAQACAGGISVMQERMPEEHMEVFGRTFLNRRYFDEQDFELLDRLADTSGRRRPILRLLLQIDITPELALERIRRRDLPAERAMAIDYLEELAEHHERFVANWSASPVLRVSAMDLDFRDPSHVEELARAVRASLADGKASI
jgi:deoxyadenosine/deoxycytidine kinase